MLVNLMIRVAETALAAGILCIAALVVVWVVMIVRMAIETLTGGKK